METDSEMEVETTDSIVVEMTKYCQVPSCKKRSVRVNIAGVSLCHKHQYPRIEPYRRPFIFSGRNEKCRCDSGLKFKNCCHPRMLVKEPETEIIEEVKDAAN